MYTAELIAARIKQLRPAQHAQIIETKYGKAVKVTGKGAKDTVGYFTRENYYGGVVNTNWKAVRHGLGYLIPLYENPLDSML